MKIALPFVVVALVFHASSVGWAQEQKVLKAKIVEFETTRLNSYKESLKLSPFGFLTSLSDGDEVLEQIDGVVIWKDQKWLVAETFLTSVQNKEMIDPIIWLDKVNFDFQQRSNVFLRNDSYKARLILKEPQRSVSSLQTTSFENEFPDFPFTIFGTEQTGSFERFLTQTSIVVESVDELDRSGRSVFQFLLNGPFAGREKAKVLYEYDSEFGNLLSRITTTVEEKDSEVENVQISYDDSVSPPRPNRVKQTIGEKLICQIYIEYWSPLPLIDDKIFYLANYGFPEPSVRTFRRGPLWFSLAIISLVFILAGAWRVRSHNAKN